MKKIISLLTVALCLIAMSGAVTAEGNDSLTPRQSIAISLLNDIGIFSEVSEESAGETVTRADFARVVVRMLGAEDELSTAPRRIYTDVLPDNEAAASIEYLYDKGIMVGYEEANFKPDGIITVGEAVKVMVIITGYSTWAENAGGFPGGYYSLDVTGNMLKGVNGAMTEGISYADAAVMVQNVLESRDYVQTTGYDGRGPVTSKTNDKDFMSCKLDIYRYTGIVEAYGDTALSGNDESYKANTVKIGGELLEDGGIDFSEYIGMLVKVYYKADDKNGNHALHVDIDSKTSYIDIKDIDISDNTSKSQIQYYVDGKTKQAKISDDAMFICNGKRLDVVTNEDLHVGNGSLRLISNDADKSYDVVIIESYETLIVDKTIAVDC